MSLLGALRTVRAARTWLWKARGEDE